MAGTMVIVCDEYLTELFRGTSNDAQRSHLSLPNKKITKLKALTSHSKFQLIDLRNNLLSSVSGLKNQCCLVYLFLQNNSIKKLEGFGALRSLESLFLDGNRIEVIENLESCPLKKLSVAAQRLSNGESLAFEPKTMKCLAFHLEVLDVSKNNLCSLKPLRHLINLYTLEAGHNKLTDAEQVIEGLSGLQRLQSLNVLGNPLMKRRSCVKALVACLQSLECLNGVAVPPGMHRACEHMRSVALDELDGAKGWLRKRTEDVPASFRVTPALVKHGLPRSGTYIDDNINVK